MIFVWIGTIISLVWAIPGLAANYSPVFFNSNSSNILVSPAQLYQVSAQRVEFGIGSQQTTFDRAQQAGALASVISSNRLFASASLSTRYPKISKGVVAVYCEGRAGKDRAESFNVSESGVKLKQNESVGEKSLVDFKAGAALSYSLLSFVSLGAGVRGERTQSQFDSVSVRTLDQLEYQAGALVHFNQFEMGAGVEMPTFESNNISTSGQQDQTFLSQRVKDNVGQKLYGHLRVAVDSHLAIGGRVFQEEINFDDSKKDAIVRKDVHIETFIASIKLEALKGSGECVKMFNGIGDQIATCDNISIGAILAMDGGSMIGAYAERSEAFVENVPYESIDVDESIAMKRDRIYWTLAMRF